MLGKKPYLTVLIPAYNEEANLRDCLKQVLRKLEQLGVNTEVLIVDDGSSDQTGSIADKLKSKDKRVKVIHHPTNFGIGTAIITGIAQAQGKWLILIPADLAIEIDDLEKYFKATKQADIVVGNRSDYRDSSLLRKIISFLNIRLIQTLFGMEERQFNYISMYRLDVLRQIKINYFKSAFFFAEILIKAKREGYKLTEVCARYLPREKGRQKGSSGKLIVKTVIDMFHFFWQLHISKKKT